MINSMPRRARRTQLHLSEDAQLLIGLVGLSATTWAAVATELGHAITARNAGVVALVAAWVVFAILCIRRFTQCGTAPEGGIPAGNAVAGQADLDQQTVAAPTTTVVDRETMVDLAALEVDLAADQQTQTVVVPPLTSGPRRTRTVTPEPDAQESQVALAELPEHPATHTDPAAGCPRRVRCHCVVNVPSDHEPFDDAA